MARALGSMTVSVRQKIGSMNPGTDFPSNVSTTSYRVVDGDLSEPTKTISGEPDTKVSVAAFCAAQANAVVAKEKL